MPSPLTGGWCLHVVFVLLLGSVAWANGLRLAPVDSDLVADPGASVTVSIRAENDSTVPWSGTPHVTPPAGWSIVIPPAAFTLGGDARGTILFTLAVPQGESAGMYPLEVAAGAANVTLPVRVTARHEVSLVVLDAPDLVVSEPYDATFGVSNRGNTRTTLQATLDTREGYTTLITPNTVTLAPGETGTIRVRVTPPEDLVALQEHRLRLRVRSDEAEDVTATATAVTEVAPAQLNEEAIYRHADLRVRFATRFDTRDLSFVEGWAFSVDGVGLLSEVTGASFAIRARNDFVRGDHSNTFTYSRDDLRVTLGNHGSVLTPSVRTSDAFGVSLTTPLAPTAALGLDLNVAAYRDEEETAGGASVDLRVGEHLTASLATAYTSTRGLITHATGTLRTPTGAPVSGDVGASIEREWRSDAHRASLHAALRTDPLILTSRFTRTTPGFDGRNNEIRVVDLRATARTPRSFSNGVGVTASGWFNHTRRLDHQNATPSEEAWGQAWGAYAFFAHPSLTARFAFANEHGPDGSRETELETRVGIPLKGRFERFEANADLTWNDDAHVTRLSLIELGAALRYDVVGGRGRTVLAASYLPDEDRFQEVDLSLVWEGDVSTRTWLRATLDLDMGDTTRGALRVESVTRLANGDTIDVQFTPSYARTTGLGMDATIGLTTPVRLRLGERENVMPVEGRVEDEEGEPISNVQIRLASLVTFTNTEGAFRFPAVPHGEHHLVVHPPEGAAERIVLPNRTIAIEVPAATEGPLVVQVVQPARVDGRIEPPAPSEATVLAGVRRAALAPGALRGITIRLVNGENVRSTLTDNEGAFTFAGLPPGVWSLEIPAEGLPPQHRLVSPPTSVRVVAGEEVRLTLQLEAIQRTIRFMDGGEVAPPPAAP